MLISWSLPLWLFEVFSPCVILFLQSKPLAAIIKDLCVGWVPHLFLIPILCNEEVLRTNIVPDKVHCRILMISPLFQMESTKSWWLCFAICWWNKAVFHHWKSQYISLPIHKMAVFSSNSNDSLAPKFWWFSSIAESCWTSEWKHPEVIEFTCGFPSVYCYSVWNSCLIF